MLENDTARTALLQAAALLAPAPHDAQQRSVVWWPLVRQVALELDQQTQLFTRDKTKNVAVNDYTGRIVAVKKHRCGRAIIHIEPNNNITTDYGYTDFLHNQAGITTCMHAVAALGTEITYRKRRETKQGGKIRHDGTVETTPRIDTIVNLDGTPITLPATAEELITKATAAHIPYDTIKQVSTSLLGEPQPATQRTAAECHMLWQALMAYLPAA